MIINICPEKQKEQTKQREDRVSTDFGLLKKYARIYSNTNDLGQPTLSRMLRSIVKSWVILIKLREKRLGL
jgi:hypothetical protein